MDSVTVVFIAVLVADEVAVEIGWDAAPKPVVERASFDDVPSRVLVMDTLPTIVVPSAYFVNLVVVVIFITELVSDEDAVEMVCE